MSYDKKNVVPGGKSEIKLKVHNDGDTELKSAYLTVDYPKTADGNAEIAKDYTKTQISLGNVKPGDTIPVSLPIKILATATAGEKVIKLNFNYKSSTGEVEKNTEEIYIDITKNEAAPELAVTGITYSGDIRVGNSFDVNLAMKNVGKSQAKKVQVSIIEGLGKDTFVPNYSTAAISVRDIKKGATGQATIPLNVPNDTTKGTKSIKVQINYEDSNGAKYKLEKEIYIVVKESTSTKTEDGTPNITIKNVSQSPSSPEAGGTVCMEYDIVNTGLIPVSEFKISASGFAENTFSPITSEPYIYVGELGAGKTQHISMTFRVSKNVTAGYGTVPLTYTYKYGKAGTEESKTATLNVIDIINENGDNSKSVPKLIISNFSTGTDKLKTGENFVFQYSIQNTHPSVAAKNIKVTVSQAENIFTVTSGSNSSYIDIIQPGQTHDCGIELNVKPDATTKSYPLVIKMQYEYEGAAASPTTGKIGEEVEETINLTVSENAKVSADNIMVQSYDEGVIVNQSVPLTFQFSNLGKSPIYNVSAVITGDFTKTDGDKQIIGTVNAGDYKDVEIYVTPSMEGDCTGQVVITYEDSTGEVMESSYDFTSFVMPEDNGGGFDPGMFPEEPPVETKKPILPVWAFVLIQIAILVVVIPVTRGIIIKCYKKKLEKEDEVI